MCSNAFPLLTAHLEMPIINLDISYLIATVLCPSIGPGVGDGDGGGVGCGNYRADDGVDEADGNDNWDTHCIQDHDALLRCYHRMYTMNEN